MMANSANIMQAQNVALDAHLFYPVYFQVSNFNTHSEVSEHLSITSGTAGINFGQQQGFFSSVIRRYVAVGLLL